MKRTFFVFLLFFASYSSGGCGPITVTLTPPSTTVRVSKGTVLFDASVSNDSSNSGVDLALSSTGTNCGATGNPCGTMSYTSTVNTSSSQSDFTSTYTAPATAPPSAVTLTATSSADSTQSASATITFGIGVTVTPASAPVQVAGTQAFTAAVAYDASNKGVTWKLTSKGTDCTLSTNLCGTVPASSASGAPITYAAPASVPASGTVALTATSVADSTQSASATITFGIGVTVTPATATVTVTGTQSFTATVANDTSNKGVAWTLASTGTICTATGNPCGTVPASSASGAPITYTAPASIPASATVTLTATSAADGKTTGTAIITLTPAIAVTLTPSSATVQTPTGTASFTATVANDASNKGVNLTLTSTGTDCTLSTNLCGTVPPSSASGAPVSYTAPASIPASATVTLTATSAADSTKSASATLTLTAPPPISVAVTPSTFSVPAGTGAQFTATVSNTSNTGVNWTVSGAGCSGATCGTVSPATSTSGSAVTYSAPPSPPNPNVVNLKATAVADGTTFANATITVAAATAAFARYLFEVNGDSTISSLVAVPSTGQLRSVTYFSVNNGFLPASSAALNPNGNALYTVQPLSTTQQFNTYSVSAGGVLGQLASTSVPGPNYGQLLADPLGRFLWVVDTASQQILSFALDPQTGVPGAQTIAANVASLNQIAADPSGSYLFSRSTSGSISAFTVSTGGTLTPLGTPPISHPFGTGSMTVAPSGKYLYAMDAFSVNAIYAYSISSAGLSSITGSPYLVSNNAGVDTEMAIEPSSSFLYAVDSSSPTQPIDAFSIGSNGGLAPLSETMQAPQNANATHISIDPSGQYVYLAYGNAHEVWTYSIGQTGASRGKLTAVNNIRTRSSAINAQLLSTGSAAVTFTPQALYVTNSLSNNVSQFSIAPSTGMLTSLASPLLVGSQPQGIAVSPSGSYAYVGYFAGTSIAPFSILNGVLSSTAQPVPAGSGPAWLTTDLSGSFLYNVNQFDSNIWEYPINSGTLAPGSDQASTGSAPVFVTTEPTGQYLYTANSGAGTIGEYSIQLPLGGLAAINTAITAEGTATAWIAVHPSGRFAYAANKNTSAGGTLGEYTITPGTGNLVLIGPQPVLPVGNADSSAVVEPSGKYIFVTDFVSNKIYSYTIDPSTGELAFNAVVGEPVATTGTGPVALAVDIAGEYLYCVNSGSSDINIYKINADGTLTAIGTATVPTGGSTPIGIAITGTLQ